jgi:hypothetical protein
MKTTKNRKNKRSSRIQQRRRVLRRRIGGDQSKIFLGSSDVYYLNDV